MAVADNKGAGEIGIGKGAASKPSNATDAKTFDTPPRLGETITVVVADDHSLFNNEIGIDFAQGEQATQVVTITTLRRLADGDLVRVG